ncbi:carboxyl-terminal processing protease [Thermomonospora echinospora]|uniref:Carboxyl-terminal processing protease n=1 Tax=Thermomonospora echinospora TaxID=1992 RepID=A0A1H5W6Z8_9ACTN|nr:S41 family peptidase [Thermomonospora echinospora]SEF94951.1 carboxyl-terminal processing protease [Thermomonospora echinospora]
MLRLTGRVPRGLTAGGLTRGAALVLVVVCAYGAGVATGAGAPPSAEPSRPGPLDEAAGRIARESALPVGRADLQRAAVDGMLRRLGDRWARYYTAQEYDDERGRLNGRYSGVGLWLGVEEDPAGGPGPVRVASVQPGSAAERAGVRVGDVVARVGDRPVDGWTVGRVAAALRGGPGSAVTLTVRRGSAEHRFRLVRATVRTGDVTVQQRPGDVQLIRVSAFTRGVGRQVRDAVGRQADRHRGGLILDLRGNPGGLLDEAVETSSALLTDGTVVTYERRGAPPRELQVTAPGDGRTPLVVLVDAGTASAAEVVAGSLRDRDRAVIIGSRTYGKGSVQEPVRLRDGSVIELTVGRYRTPSGRDLDGAGIDPDVTVSADHPPEEAVRRADTVLRGLVAAAPTKDRG